MPGSSTPPPAREGLCRHRPLPQLHLSWPEAQRSLQGPFQLLPVAQSTRALRAELCVQGDTCSSWRGGQGRALPGVGHSHRLEWRSCPPDVTFKSWSPAPACDCIWRQERKVPWGQWVDLILHYRSPCKKRTGHRPAQRDCTHSRGQAGSTCQWGRPVHTPGPAPSPLALFGTYSCSVNCPLVAPGS